MRILFLIILLVLSPLTVIALEECQRITFEEDIPCTIISSDKPSTGCIENVSIFLENGTFFASQSWGDNTPFCNYTWNISDRGTYKYNSTIENGVITVEKKDNMLSIILVQIGMIIFLILMGLPHKIGFAKFLSWGLAIIEAVITVWLVYLKEVGGDIIGLLWINAISFLLIAGTLGVYSVFIMQVRVLNPARQNLNQDSFTKYAFIGEKQTAKGWFGGGKR